MEYTTKSAQYFAGARRLFVDDLPENVEARLLEIGCGSGNTAEYALASKKCGWCCGIELCPGPAEEARKRLHQVLVGDIEKLELEFPPRSFDVLLMSEVLEHLTDPLAVLIKLRPLMKPGALVMAGSPNVCHHSVLRMLLGGGFDYQREGVMDATHLRWFSPRTYREMFVRAGYVVDAVRPANPLRWKARLLNGLMFNRFEYLFHTQIYLRAHCP